MFWHSFDSHCSRKQWAIVLANPSIVMLLYCSLECQECLECQKCYVTGGHALWPRPKNSPAAPNLKKSMTSDRAEIWYEYLLDHTTSYHILH